MTKEIKIVIGVLFGLIIVYLFNVRSQNSYEINSTAIYAF